MADTYLPADVRKRIVDVMRERKMTQRELALRIDVNESTISRFLSGKTEKLSEESVIRIARVFNVSTDFILGTTVIPDKKNYDISELGLSVEAAKNLYTGKVNNDVVNRLLENPRFAMVTYMIAQYMDDTLAGGYAAQNQMYATLSSMLLGINKTSAAVQAARTANAMTGNSRFMVFSAFRPCNVALRLRQRFDCWQLRLFQDYRRIRSPLFSKDWIY